MADDQPVIITCPRCKQTHMTKEPCIGCYGSDKPGGRQCGTCFSFENGHCRRIKAAVRSHWTGCILHVPKVLKLKIKGFF